MRRSLLGNSYVHEQSFTKVHGPEGSKSEKFESIFGKAIATLNIHPHECLQVAGSTEGPSNT